MGTRQIDSNLANGIKHIIILKLLLYFSVRGWDYWGAIWGNEKYCAHWLSSVGRVRRKVSPIVAFPGLSRGRAVGVAYRSPDDDAFSTTQLLASAEAFWASAGISTKDSMLWPWHLSGSGRLGKGTLVIGMLKLLLYIEWRKLGTITKERSDRESNLC